MIIEEVLKTQKMLTKDFIKFLEELLKEVSTGLSEHDTKVVIENRIRDDKTFVTRITQLLESTRTMS
jgi:hypothetical protein